MSKELLDYMARELRGMHGLYERVLADLDDAQVNSVPPGGNQNIAFCLWHYVRTEDNIIQFVMQRKPTVWMAGGWDKRFGLDPKSQGTGFSEEQARDFRLSSIADFRTYMTDVFRHTEEYVATLTPADGDRQVKVWPMGEMPLIQCLSGMCMTHGYRHLGEIEFAKGLVGLKGSSTGI